MAATAVGRSLKDARALEVDPSDLVHPVVRRMGRVSGLTASEAGGRFIDQPAADSPAVLTIRNAQLDVFREARARQFRDQLVSYIAAEYPRHFDRLGAEGTRAFVERSIESAARLGITIEGSVGALAELWLVYGEALERAPDREWAQNILAHKELPAYIKIEAIQGRIYEKTGGRAMVVFAGSN